MSALPMVFPSMQTIAPGAKGADFEGCFVALCVFAFGDFERTEDDNE
jgi:hypothetical protein